MTVWNNGVDQLAAEYPKLLFPRVSSGVIGHLGVFAAQPKLAKYHDVVVFTLSRIGLWFIDLQYSLYFSIKDCQLMYSSSESLSVLRTMRPLFVMNALSELRLCPSFSAWS